MANRAGGYALNEVIELFEREGVWTLLGPARSRELLLKILEIGRLNDCSSSDVFGDNWTRYRMCAFCFCESEELRYDVCPVCYEKLHVPASRQAKPS